MPKPVVIFIANRGYALSSSRTGLIQSFLSANWTVVLATEDDAESQKLCNMGSILESVTFNRGGLSPLADFKAYCRIRMICHKWRPLLVQNFHAKPVIFGTQVAKWILGDETRVVNTITGLGHAFVKGGLPSHLARLGYQIAIPKADVTIFQNRDDQNLFLEKCWVNRKQARLITGSGVDTDRFAFVDRQARDGRTPVVVMLGRLLREKGIPEFLEVAKRIRKRWPGARFLWAGEEDLVHPDAVSIKWFQSQDAIEYLGRLSDVVPLLTDADILLFPSYYREGVPRVLLEAAAMGLPTVAFDVPGVREAVRNAETGYLVPDRAVDEMTHRVAGLLEDRELRLSMGIKARQMVEDAFDVSDIQRQYLQVYRDLGIKI